MAQSLSNVLVHIVFSTKNRRPWINVELDEELAKYVAGTCRELGCPSHRIGGADDHLHIACSLSRTMSISKLIEEIKTSSSKWIKTKGDRYADFAWQTATAHSQLVNHNWKICAATLRNSENTIGD